MCRRSMTVEGRRYVCSHPDLKRPLTPAEALAYSCNDYFVSLAPRLPRDAQRRSATGRPRRHSSRCELRRRARRSRWSARHAACAARRHLTPGRRGSRSPDGEGRVDRRVLRDGLAGAARYGTVRHRRARTQRAGEDGHRADARRIVPRDCRGARAGHGPHPRRRRRDARRGRPRRCVHCRRLLRPPPASATPARAPLRRRRLLLPCRRRRLPRSASPVASPMPRCGKPAGPARSASAARRPMARCAWRSWRSRITWPA